MATAGGRARGGAARDRSARGAWLAPPRTWSSLLPALGARAAGLRAKPHDVRRRRDAAADRLRLPSAVAILPAGWSRP